MGAERLEVGIRLHVVEVVVAEEDRPGEGVDRLVGTPGAGERAGQVVAGEKVVGLKQDEVT